MKDPRDIILAPVVSEKAYDLMEMGVYTFKVSQSASKPEIRDAVEAIWGVEVSRSTRSTARARPPACVAPTDAAPSPTRSGPS